MKKYTHTEKALSWVKRSLKNYRGLPFEPLHRNYDLVNSYRHDAEDGNLLETDVRPDGAPSKTLKLSDLIQGTVWLLNNQYYLQTDNGWYERIVTTRPIGDEFETIYFWQKSRRDHTMPGRLPFGRIVTVGIYHRKWNTDDEFSILSGTIIITP